MATNLLTDEEVFGRPSGRLLSDDEVFGAAPAPAPGSGRSAADWARDVGVTALKGAVGLPQAFAGLLNLADTVNRGTAPASLREAMGDPTSRPGVSKALEDAGLRFEDAQKGLDELYSPAQQAANRKVAEADGFLPTVQAALENPSTIARAAVESIPQMLGGAAVGRAVVAGAPKVAPWLAGAIGEGAIGAGSAAEQIRGETKDGELTLGQALAALGSGATTAALGAAGGRVAQKLGLGDVDTMLVAGPTKLKASPLGFAKQVIGSGISEGVFEELPQSITEQMWQNYATGKPVMEGVGNAAAMGLLTGAAMGAAGGGYNAAAGMRGAAAPAPAAPGTPGTPAGTPGTPGTPGTEPIPATEVLGGETETAPRGTPAEPTDAEKALLKPTQLTDLDRVQAIDAELSNAEGKPEVAAALQAERAQLTRNWPQLERGAPAPFTTEAGAKVDSRYALVDIDKLVTSHDEDLKANAAYPQELQPRQRDRAASEMQVQAITQKLDPARLGQSADAATGAPIVGADGLVESGNARTIAMKRVYQADGLTADEYRGWLRANAAQFGLQPEQVDALAKPMLVRVRTTPVDRAEFARQANAPTVAAMSPVEQARSDAARIDVMDDLQPDENGDFATSRDFIRRFVGRLPMTEQTGMLDAGGRLSSAGYSRVRNAVLAKAYGNSPVLTRMVESMNDDMRNVTRALMIAAPRVAQARGAIAEGRRFDADITPHLVAAAEQLASLKERGTSVDDALAQSGLLGEEFTPETRELMRFIAENTRRPRRMAEFITAYFDALDAAGDPAQGSLLGEVEAPRTSALMQAARAAVEGPTNEQQAAPEDAGRGQPRADRPVAAVQPADAPGNRRGDQGAGAPAAEVDWVDFPEATGTLGIPRAEMPQIPGKDRGALVAFLEARGIPYERTEVAPDSLRPTQREFSRKKTQQARQDTGGAKTVIVSGDGYVLDGHHRWMAQLVDDKPVDVMRFDAPIRELLAAVREFPGTKSSAPPSTPARDAKAQALADFQDALADLATLASRYTRATMIPAREPELMPTLRRLAGAAIRIVGTDLRRVTRWVGNALRRDPATRRYADKVTPQQLRQAAQEALAAIGDDAPQRGLFDDAEARRQIAIGGLLYDLDAPNFDQPPAPITIPDGHPLLRSTETLDETPDGKPREDLRRAIEDGLFEAAKPVEGRKPIAYVMGGGGASGKWTILIELRRQGVVQDAEAVRIDPDDIKASIPEWNLIVAAGDSRAAAITHDESSLIAGRARERAIKGRYDLTLDVTLGDPQKGRATLQALKDAGYEVRLIGVTVPPETAIVRMFQRGRGSGRYVPTKMLLAAHKGFTQAFAEYAEMADEARLYDNGDSRVNLAEKVGGTLTIKDPGAYNVAIARSGRIYEDARTLRGIQGGVDRGQQGGLAPVRQDQRPVRGPVPEAQADVGPGGDRRADQGTEDPRGGQGRAAEAGQPAGRDLGETAAGLEAPDAPRTEGPASVAEPIGNGQGDLFADQQFERQLDLFLDSEPDPSQAGPGIEAARGAAAQALRVLRRSGTLLGRALSGGLAERQRVNLVGRVVRKPEDLATLAQVYRDPRFETFRVFFTDKRGKIVSQFGLTSRLPGSTAAVIGEDLQAYFGRLALTAKNAGATGYYLLHNHPSGIASPSRADENVTRWYAAKVPSLKLGGHVVIDTNQFAVIDGSGQWEMKFKDFGAVQPFAAGEFAGLTVASPARAIELAKRMQVDDDAITLMVMSTQLEVRGITSIPSALAKAVSSGTADERRRAVARLKLAMRREALENLGSRIIAVGRDLEALKNIRTYGLVEDAVHVSDAGAAISVSEKFLFVGRSDALPAERRPRVAPATSPEFDYLRRDALADKTSWRRKVAEPAPTPKTIDDVRAIAQGLDVRLDVDESPRRIDLMMIERNPGAAKGTGGQVMQALIAYADARRKAIVLDVKDGAGSLGDWYAGMGFEPVDSVRGRDWEAPMRREPAARAVREDAATFGPGAAPAEQPKTAAQRADEIISKVARTPTPIDATARLLTRVTGINRLAAFAYDRGGRLLDWITPEKVKAGITSDYGVPEAVIDERAAMQGRQRRQLREAGALVEKLSTLTRAESRVAYEWMNMDGSDPRAYLSMMQGLPEESVKVLQEVQQLIESLSKEAVRLGQLEPEAYERHRMAYLRRSYAKHTAELTGAEKARRGRAISILGDQYRGRGMVQAVAMDRIKQVAPEWWQRKFQDGKADTGLKGQKFERLERRAASGERTAALPGIDGRKPQGKVLEVHWWPAGQKRPAQYADWDSAGTWEVRDTKGGNLVMWRDFTQEEQDRMGRIDEARFAIAKTLQGMIHDVEVGRYLEWLAQKHAKADGDAIDGELVDASESMRDVFAPGTWVKVPDSEITGTSVSKYGKLAGLYLPGPIWNDLRQTVNGRFKPFGEAYDQVLRAWKISKTALSPAVHTNNVMSNMVMADWHGVTAGHVVKALGLVMAASDRKGLGALGIRDRDAAREVLTRYEDAGGAIGGWVTQEIRDEQMAPIIEALRRELQKTDQGQAQIGVYAAMQHLLHKRFPEAVEALRGSSTGTKTAAAAKVLMDLYQAEDDVFRLAAWLKAKEQGATDLEAGKVARRSFLDYSINAPWIAAMRSTAFPFISFTYRAVPMLLETAGKHPEKLLKLMALAGGLNALGVMLGGGGDDEERKLLPEEKAGRIWGMVPKLIRMPWNDAHGSPVYLDIRRWIPVGDVVDVSAGHAAVPLLPAMYPGGPLVVFGELVANKSMFTGKPIVLETDTAGERARKVVDYLWKAFSPNLVGVPGTYATQGVADSITGRTDKFGREMSTAQALASSVGVKLGSYPTDVLRNNLMAKQRAEVAEIDRVMADLKRRRQTNRIDADDFQEQMLAQQQKKQKLRTELAEKMN